MAKSVLIEDIFTPNHPCTRIGALKTAIDVAAANNVEAFPARPDATDKDRKAVSKAAQRITDAFAAGELPAAGDVAVVYNGGVVVAGNDGVLFAHRMQLAIDDYVAQEPLN